MVVQALHVFPGTAYESDVSRLSSQIVKMHRQYARAANGCHSERQRRQSVYQFLTP